MPPLPSDFCGVCHGLREVRGDTSAKYFQNRCHRTVECIQEVLELEEKERQEVFEQKHRETYEKRRREMPAGDSEHKLLLDKVYYRAIYGIWCSGSVGSPYLSYIDKEDCMGTSIVYIGRETGARAGMEHIPNFES
jgi:hypothetical protein